MAGTRRHTALAVDPEALPKHRKSFRWSHSHRDGCSLVDTFGPLVADAIFDKQWHKDVYEILGRHSREAWSLEDLQEEIPAGADGCTAPIQTN